MLVDMARLAAPRRENRAVRPKLATAPGYCRRLWVLIQCRFVMLSAETNPLRAAGNRSKMTDYIQVVTTTGRRKDAEAISRALVEQRLAACVQVLGPITSTYRWAGSIETNQEWQCVAKSRREAYYRIEQAIRRLHPYEVPEILATQIVAGDPAYLAWLEAEVDEE